MNTDIFIVSYHKDFPFLQYCLKSIEKFATGFHNVVLMIPRRDMDEFWCRVDPAHCRQVNLVPFDEWPDKGMLHHMALVMTAPNYCHHADLILHMDSDCVFTEPVTPGDYIRDGKPILLHARYDWLIKQQGNLLNWKVAAQNALGIEVEHEFMRRHPSLHLPAVYAKTRAMIEEQHQRLLEDYIKSQRNEFPQTFAEFPTLGAVAWNHFHDQYHWVNQETEPWPPNKMKQYWSHGGVSAPVLEEFKRFGLA